jgi:hypothetical protein
MENRHCFSDLERNPVNSKDRPFEGANRLAWALAHGHFAPQNILMSENLRRGYKLFCPLSPWHEEGYG